MGRKRRNRDKVRDAHAKTSSLHREGLLEVLRGMNEIGGIAPTSSSSRKGRELRQQMILCLKRLRNSLRMSDNKSIGHRNGEEVLEDDNRLIQVEEAAASVRSTCNELVEEFAEERADLLLLYRKMENLGGMHILNPPDATVEADVLRPVQVSQFLRSLAIQYRAQLQLEESVVEEVSTFLSAELYVENYGSADTQTQRNADMIDQWTRCLDERINLDKMHWKYVSVLIDKLEESQTVTGTNRTLLPRTTSVDTVEDLSKASHESSKGPSRKDRILAEKTLMGALDVFVEQEAGSYCNGEAGLTLLLLIGDSGSGKTHLCDQIELKICCAGAPEDGRLSGLIQLFRPSLPLDIMGRSVGETEDIIVSLFGRVLNEGTKSVLILDDVEHLLGDSFAAPLRSEDKLATVDMGESHVLVRARSTFFSILDTLTSNSLEQAQENAMGKEALVVCTARSAGDDVIGQFDKVFVLDAPGEEERRRMIVSCLGIEMLHVSDLVDDEVDSLLTDLAKGTIGRSYAEIAEYCRGACSVSGCSEDDAPRQLNILRAMKESLGGAIPESLRAGSLNGFVDMRVLSARELTVDKRSSPMMTPLSLPLFGNDAEEAWRQMEGLVVTPLCRAEALNEIMFGTSKAAARTMCAGVLLTGPPGCGKSALALHCAKAAATVLPSVSLLDVSCTSMVHKEVGASERTVQRLFAAARAAAPCIIIMDGIENIAAVRGNDNTTEGTMDRVLSTLLTELDGIDNDVDLRGPGDRPSGGIAVIGITQNPSWVDPALRRPGRLEKVIQLRHPDYDSRRSIFLRETEKLPIDFSSNLTGNPSSLGSCHVLAEHLAAQCKAMSAAEVIAVCKDACVISARRQLDQEIISTESRAIIKVEDFQTAVEMRRNGNTLENTSI